MTTERDSSIPSSTAHGYQFYADFDPSTVSNENEQSASPPSAHTAVPIRSLMKTAIEPATVLNELVNQRLSSTTQRKLNSQEVLRVTQYLDKQEKMVNNKMAVVLCLSIFTIAVGAACIGLFIAYHSDSCGYYHTATSCIRIYSSLIIGCVVTFLGILRIAILCSVKIRLSRTKRLWHEKVAQLRQTSLNGY